MKKSVLVAALAAVFAGPGMANEQPSNMTLAMHSTSNDAWVQPVALDQQIDVVAEERMAQAMEKLNEELNERMEAQFQQDFEAPSF